MTLFRRLSFQAKIFLSFALVIMLTTGFGYLFLNRAIDQEFENFVQRSARGQANVFADLLANYYERTGSWQEFLEKLKRDVQTGRRSPFVLADRDGIILTAPSEKLIGQKLSENELKSALPIIVSGQVVGNISVLSPTRWRSPLEQEYARFARNALWWAGLLAGGIALLIGFWLLRQTMVPLRELNAAAQQITRGHLNERVRVHNYDELGHLAQSFNEMAASLEKSEKAKRHMIADVAHELRNPISIVRAGLEGLMDGVLQPTPDNFAALHNKSLLVSRLVDDLQQLAQADAGQLSIQKQPCDLRELLQHIHATIGVQLEEQGVKLSLELSEELPLVEADIQRIEQVLLNLLSNATRHTPSGGTIRVVAQKLDEGSVRVSVCDTGLGLSEEDLAHAFDRFYRADKSRARSSGGSGLGLSISKALIEAHGGRIWADHALGGGACFHFTLGALAGSSHSGRALAKK